MPAGGATAAVLLHQRQFAPAAGSKHRKNSKRKGSTPLQGMQPESNDSFLRCYGDDMGDLDAHDLAQMLSIGGVSSAEQAAVADEIIAEFDKDGNLELDEEEQRAFKNQLRNGIGPVDAMFDANDQIMQPSAVVQALSDRAKERVGRAAAYKMLAAFLLNFILYLVVLVMQRRPSEAFAVEEAVTGALFSASTQTIDSNDGRVAQEMDSTTAFYKWLESSVLRPVFVDPTCGNSICESPEEFVGGFSTQGCAADCGAADPARMTNLSITIDFSDLAAFGCLHALSSRWNLCLRTDPSKCAFVQTPASPYGETIVASDETGRYEHNISVFDAPWELHLWVGTQDDPSSPLEELGDYRPAVTVTEVRSTADVANGTAVANGTSVEAVWTTPLVSTNSCWTPSKSTNLVPSPLLRQHAC